jgi:hypothetical protein
VYTLNKLGALVRQPSHIKKYFIPNLFLSLLVKGLQKEYGIVGTVVRPSAKRIKKAYAMV